jgi:hypothetical protein
LPVILPQLRETICRIKASDACEESW